MALTEEDFLLIEDFERDTAAMEGKELEPIPESLERKWADVPFFNDAGEPFTEETFAQAQKILRKGKA